MTNRLRRKTPMWFLILTCFYGAILASLTVLNRFGADRTWFGALNLYLPQIVWATPGVLLTVLSLKVARQWVWAPLLCVAWVLGPVMGFCWAIQGPTGPVDVRVMTWNVKYGGGNEITQQAIALNIDAVGPNVVLMQDAWGLLDGPIGSYLRGWNVRSDYEYIIASKFPLDEAEVRRIPFLGEELHVPAVSAARRHQDRHPVQRAFSVAEAGARCPHAGATGAPVSAGCHSGARGERGGPLFTGACPKKADRARAGTGYRRR